MVAYNAYILYNYVININRKAKLMYLFDYEERFLLLGMSESAKVCIVCHCYRESDTVIRIISARKATRKEEQRYAEGI